MKSKSLIPHTIYLQELSIWPPFWPPISLHWGRWGRWRPNAECICIINSLDKFVVSKARVWYPTWHTFWKFNFTPFLPAQLPPGPPQKVGLESTKWKILLGASISTQTIQHIPNSANSDNPVNAQLLFYRPLCPTFLKFSFFSFQNQGKIAETYAYSKNVTLYCFLCQSCVDKYRYFVKQIATTLQVLRKTTFFKFLIFLSSGKELL